MAIANSTGVRTAVYLRASSAGQTESLDAQRMLLERYASDHDLHVVAEYSDFAISGDTSTRRPGLQDLMADARESKFSAVLVRDLSRLSRRDSLKSAAQIVGPLLDAGCTIYTAANGDLQLNSSTGRIMLSVLAEFDHAENVKRAMNVVNGQMKAASGGSWVGAAPYGYRVEGEKHAKHLVIDCEDKAAVVRRAFELYADGESCEGIARQFNADGIPAVKGGKWTRDTIRDLFDRVAYVGDLRFNRQSHGKYYALRDGKPVERRGHWIDDNQERARVETNDPDEWIYHRDTHPAIVSRELWDRVQRRLELASKNKPGPTDKTFVLTGILRCTCGCTRDMYGKFRAGKKRYQCEGCSGWVKESEVLDAIGRRVQRAVTPETVERLRAAMEKQVAKPQKRTPNVKQLQAELAKQERKLVKLDADMLAPVQAEIRKLRRQIQEAKSARHTAQQAHTTIVDDALALLFRLPDVLRESHEGRLKANLAELLDEVKVKSESTGKGKGKRWRFAGGQVVFNTHAAPRAESNRHFPGCRPGVFAVGPRDHVSDRGRSRTCKRACKKSCVS